MTEEQVFNTEDVFTRWIKGRERAFSCNELESVFQTDEVFTKWLQEARNKKDNLSLIRRSSSFPNLNEFYQQNKSYAKHRKESVMIEEKFRTCGRQDRRGIVISRSIDQLENILIEPSDKLRSSKLMKFRLYIRANYRTSDI